MMYWVKRKIWQIKNVIKWLPKIWNQYDFDYGYSLEVFKFQLQKQAEYLESNKACTLSAKDNASRIRMVIRLMDKVYDEEYGLEYQRKFDELYGDGHSDLQSIPKGDKLFMLKQKFELGDDKEKIREMNQVQSNLFLESQKKQKRAHKLLWDLIEHNIQGWWD